MRERIQRTIDDMVAGGSETGLQVAVLKDGEAVVDVTAGRIGPGGSPVTPGTLSKLVREEVTGPLDIADEVHLGVPENLLPRVATQVAGRAPQRPDPGSPPARATPPAVMPDAEYANRRDVLTSDIPSAGTMSA